MSPIVSVSPSTITTTLCCLVLNSSAQDLSTQLSTTHTPDRAGPNSNPKLLEQTIPGKMKP